MYQESTKIKAKKKFGQNFLVDENIIQKIIEIINPKNKNIIEIGPGRGAITKFLTKEAQNLITFEIDDDMIEYLLNNNILLNSQIVKGDFLEANLSQYKNYEIVGNIPYYITSEIIFKLLENRHLFKRAILLVQDEVANRLVAKKNEKDYSKLTITANYVANIKKELFVKNKCFVPSPKVNSAIVTLEFKDNVENFNELKNFFKLCFLSRRKKLIWSLKTKYPIDKIQNAYHKNNLNEFTRIQELSLEQIVDLYYSLEK
ncbi:16S rRNA (adenine(1518)-N(6)/adenine(1519)-N(6))-dimethyltransferase RsmA [Mycoplasmopsis lipofaciens]|uniref:16S rRNA (adenine(1518)-N(6)/adenine(1519)-N(6))- dimethyltransferase RsmA n=1 Tax=Mycoplasmopsis lipofaciens TaxID=114884 RepID=UPI000488AF93|nr:16S rRNA (adenine(1518)-N(6)/adenine(1519)-N(6))-dimethyltransferase RsmA [Mycoplasmopsis lipofaciens]